MCVSSPPSQRFLDRAAPSGVERFLECLEHGVAPRLFKTHVDPKVINYQLR